MKKVLNLLMFLVLTSTVGLAQQLVMDKNISGSYTGELPCADCKSVKTILTVDADFTAAVLWINEFEDGKAGDPRIEKGKWSVEGNTMTIVFDKMTKKYMIGKDTLTLIEDNGVLISSDDAGKYILKKL